MGDVVYVGLGEVEAEFFPMRHRLRARVDRLRSLTRSALRDQVVLGTDTTRTIDRLADDLMSAPAGPSVAYLDQHAPMVERMLERADTPERAALGAGNVARVLEGALRAANGPLIVRW